MMIFGLSPMRSISTMPDASTRSERRGKPKLRASKSGDCFAVRTDAGQIGAAVFIGRGGDGLRQHVEGSTIERRFRWRRFGGGCLGRDNGFRFLLFPGGRVEHIEINELVASSNEGAWCLSFPEAIDGDALFADAGCEAGEIAIA